MPYSQPDATNVELHPQAKNLFHSMLTIMPTRYECKQSSLHFNSILQFSTNRNLKNLD